jgi:hypothetical protein
MVVDVATRRANKAALANLAVIMAMPMLLAIVGWSLTGRMRNGGVTVYSNGDPGIGDAMPRGCSPPCFARRSPRSSRGAPMSTPYGRLTDGTGGWQGVAEAAGIGFGFMLLTLLPNFLIYLLLTVPPPVTVYAGIGAVFLYSSIAGLIGALLGLVLRLTALVALRLRRLAIGDTLTLSLDGTSQCHYAYRTRSDHADRAAALASPPLQPETSLILAALGDGPSHGYESV